MLPDEIAVVTNNPNTSLFHTPHNKSTSIFSTLQHFYICRNITHVKRPHLVCRPRIALRAVSGESLSEPGAFFTGANSSSRFTSSRATRCAHEKVSKMNSSSFMPCPHQRRPQLLVIVVSSSSLPCMIQTWSFTPCPKQNEISPVLAQAKLRLRCMITTSSSMQYRQRHNARACIIFY